MTGTLIEALVRQDLDDSLWRIAYQWRGWDLDSCPNWSGELKRILRRNPELNTRRYSLCVRCRTRCRNAINYRTRSPEARRRAALRSRRYRIHKRVARLQAELASIEAKLCRAM